MLSLQLLGLVDGTAIIPAATVIDDSGNYVHNVHFYEYLRIDKQVKSWNFATLSRDVFVDVHDLHTSVEIWNRLQSRFMHASMARSMELKGRLSHIKKADSQSTDGLGDC